MSTDSQSEMTDTSPQVDLSGGAKLSDLVAQFDSKDYAHFHVEFREDDEDLIYHFWPPGEEGRFVPGFHLHLEGAFREMLPPDAMVRADYTDFDEARVKLKEGVGLVPQKDFHKELVVARETYYVRVVDALKNPLADKFLKERVFGIIEDNISRSH